MVLCTSADSPSAIMWPRTFSTARAPLHNATCASAPGTARSNRWRALAERDRVADSTVDQWLRRVARYLPFAGCRYRRPSCRTSRRSGAPVARRMSHGTRVTIARRPGLAGALPRRPPRMRTDYRFLRTRCALRTRLENDVEWRLCRAPEARKSAALNQNLPKTTLACLGS